MANTEGVIQAETETRNVLVESINNQQPTIESIIAEEIREEKIEKEIPNETINNIHTYLFEILAFFSNSQPHLIVEYCQETQNVCMEYILEIILFVIYFSGILSNVFLMMKILIFYLYSSVILKNEVVLVKDQVSVTIFQNLQSIK
jgi:hypothetical protein